MTQLTLALQSRRVPARQLPAIERLRAVLTRQGIDWRYRATRNSILFRPMFGPHFGWQLMCGRYCCQGAELAAAFGIPYQRVYKLLRGESQRDAGGPIQTGSLRGKKAAGRMLDVRTHDGFPGDAS